MVHIKSLAAFGARAVRSDAPRSVIHASRSPNTAPTSCIASVRQRHHLLSLRPYPTGQSPLRSYSAATSKPPDSLRSSPRDHIRYRSSIRSNKLSRTQIRSCSYQRHNMCRHSLGADIVQSAVDVTKSREVLPTNVKPLHYRLTLEPNLETFEYTGTVEIEYVEI